MAEHLRSPPGRHRHRVALGRFHGRPSPPARRWGKRGADAHAIGRSRGGRSTKVQLVVDALGLPVDFVVTGGERHDSQPAPEPIERCSPKQLLADKAYDSNAIREQLEAIGCAAVIPPRSNRVNPAPFDKHLYKARSAVEFTFALFKQARRFATRYEKTLRSDTAVVLLCCIKAWLRI